MLAICYVRHPLDYATSVCQQLIKGGADHLPQVFSPAYRKRIEPYRRRLRPEQLIVRRFDRDHLHRGCVVADFCDILGIDSNSLTIKPRNESLPAAAIQALYQLNNSGILRYGDQQIIQARHHFLAVLNQIFAGTPKLERQLLAAHSDYSDCTYLAEHFGILFQEPSDSDAQPLRCLHRWLEEFDTTINERIQHWLHHTAGLSGHYPGSNGAIQRLFFQCLNSAMLAEHKDLLRSVARKADNNEPIPADEALRLRSLARQARPGTPAPEALQ